MRFKNLLIIDIAISQIILILWVSCDLIDGRILNCLLLKTQYHLSTDCRYFVWFGINVDGYLLYDIMFYTGATLIIVVIVSLIIMLTKVGDFNKEK